MLIMAFPVVAGKVICVPIEFLLPQILSLWKMKRKVSSSEYLLYAYYYTGHLTYAIKIIKSMVVESDCLGSDPCLVIL